MDISDSSSFLHTLKIKYLIVPNRLRKFEVTFFTMLNYQHWISQIYDNKIKTL